MAMPLAYAIKTSLRKYRRKKLRTFFGIFPTIMLLVVIVVLSGLALSADRFVRDRILSKIEHREEVLELNRAQGSYISGPPSQANPKSDEDGADVYSSEDLAKIRAVEHVVAAQPERPLPDLAGISQDLASGAELAFTSIIGAPPELGRLYNANDFVYRPGQPVPIIISRSTFVESHVDFGGKTEIKIDGTTIPNTAKYNELNPLKSRFLNEAYDKKALLGKTFTSTFGGLPRIPAYSQDLKSDPKTGTITTFKPLSAAAIAKLTQEQRDKINPYWNYDALSKGVPMRFKIVGFSESLDGATQIIPAEAGRVLSQQLYDLQSQARTTKALPSTAYDSAFAGWRLTKSGLVVDGQWGKRFQLHPAQVHEEMFPGAGPSVDPGPAIPGWLYQYQTKNGEQVPGEVANFSFKLNTLPIKSLAVTLDDAGNREKTQKALVAAGYPEAEGGFSIATLLRQLREGLNGILFWIVAVLAVINALILIASVSRSVADAQREIGVYRALGARRRDIRLLYVVYAALQTAIGVVVGAALGVVAIIPVSNALARTAQSITGGVVLDVYGLDLAVRAADLRHIDLWHIALYSLAIIAFTVVVSLLPAARAARISPIEAIRRGE